jgi:transcriptional regulator with XRE-family HTH domain
MTPRQRYREQVRDAFCRERQELRLSIDSMAAKLEMKPDHLQRIEAGDPFESGVELLVLAAATGKPVSELLQEPQFTALIERIERAEEINLARDQTA